MTLIFAYLAGLLTLINPCVLPVLPIVVTGALGKHRLGPVAMAAGMSLSFVILGLTVAAFGHAIGLTEDRLNGIAAIGMLAFGAALLMPQAARCSRPPPPDLHLVPMRASTERRARGWQVRPQAVCCWAPHGAPASGRHWVVPSRWPAVAAASGRQEPSWQPLPPA